MKDWSIWDDQVCRILRGAAASAMPELIVVPGFEGGTALWLNGELTGHWVATSRETFSFLPSGPILPRRDGVPLLDILDATEQLFGVALQPSRPVFEDKSAA